MLFGNGAADEPVRIRRIGAHRQRIVNLILRRVRQPEQIGEVAVELRRTRGYRARALVLARNEVVHVRVAAEEEELVAAVDELRDHDRPADRQRQVVRTAGIVERLAGRGKGQPLAGVQLVELVRPVPDSSPCPGTGSRPRGSSSKSAGPCRARPTRRSSTTRRAFPESCRSSATPRSGGRCHCWSRRRSSSCCCPRRRPRRRPPASCRQRTPGTRGSGWWTGSRRTRSASA